jgi:thiol:disulfide interchange protein DsbD
MYRDHRSGRPLFVAALPPKATARHPKLCALLALAFAMVSALAAVRASAKPYWMQGSVSNAAEFLPPEQAFRLSAHADGGLLRIRWVIADGYYLYRSRIEVRAESPDLVLDAPTLPPGTMLSDAYLGTQTVYRQQLEVTAGFHQLDHGAHPIQVRVSYQGCAQAGLCYPLLTEVIFPEPLGSPKVQPAASPWNQAAAGVGAGSSAWEPLAIVGGLLAFLMAGLWLRPAERRLPPGGVS